ncbi:MAG: patatin-like phospholipase family protein, partial [Rhodobacterales bacterium]
SITSHLTAPHFIFDKSRTIFGELAAAIVIMSGFPCFFRPRSPFEFMAPTDHQPLSVYDSDALLDLVDFDYLNDAGPRLSIGELDVEIANFTYFDSNDMRITPEHIMASGTLPPSFA